jgi:hypothetical protein
MLRLASVVPVAWCWRETGLSAVFLVLWGRVAATPPMQHIGGALVLSSAFKYY